MESSQRETVVHGRKSLFGSGVATADSESVDDPVLAALAQAEDSYRSVRARWEQGLADLQRGREELARLRESERNSQEEAKRLRTLLERERQQQSRQRDRADRLTAALKDIHRALFGGNVFDLILKACASITGATRGLYVTSLGEDRFAVRAAHDVRGYPRKPPSEFIRALCRQAIGEGQSLVCNGPAELRRFPAPDGPDETFHNCLAAPAVLLRQFNGVVILADKPGAGFDREDVDLVLSIGDQAGVALENRQLQDELLRAYFSVVGVLADAIEAKDPYTHGHCEMVARYSRRTAARLAASDKLRSVCCYGGLLHDVGKIGVSDGVLNKPGKLLPEEWELMRSHVRIGKDILAHVPALDGVADVVLHHHERYDGQGYPAGLKGEDIPIAARIVCVVDAYCAMISKRSYKESASPEEARQELIRCKGTHFDPEVVDTFLAVLDTPEEEDGTECELLPEEAEAADFRHALRAPPKRV